ncbi:MAG TPA: hypothetical protein VME47_08040 [Acetobacteraceae bacterium]|nr:hypothetical protein [Acetobacteraceae bacterium]
MTIMLSKLYAALNAAGTPEQEAQAAAQEVGELREETTALANGLSELTREVRRVGIGLDDLRTEVSTLRSEFHYMRGRFDVLLWAVGINAAATIAILGVLLRR